MSKLVILTDLGTFKAFRLEDDGLSSSPRLQQVDGFESACGDDRISRKVSDKVGQHQKGALSFVANNDGANGEPHNLFLEEERRSVRLIAERMEQLINSGDVDACYFAAASEINNTIVDHLAPQTKAKIEKNVRRNLVNAQRDEILNQFKN